MSDAVRLLAEQALRESIVHDDVYRPEGFANAVSKTFADRFAELIVQKCLEFCEDTPESGDEWDCALRSASSSIKGHFGVF